jgi:hypothetical protein
MNSGTRAVNGASTQLCGKLAETHAPLGHNRDGAIVE